MKAWRLRDGGHTLEVLYVDDETGEIAPKVIRLKFKQRITQDEARLWMVNHYPRSRASLGRSALQ